MEPRVSIITLGVSDLARARRFYEALGFRASSASQGDVVFFHAGGIALALFPREELAKDAGVAADGSGFAGFTIAHNVRAREEVAQVLAAAAAAGGRIVKPAQDVFWGGHSGYFADPDGRLWEVAWNPFFEITPEGALKLPE
jgi:catechol 2,3-dioxygenase-like lactoylglutathione lyase family enzyme